MVGRVFNAFAATVSLAVLASCVVSLTLTPLMASRLKAVHRPGLVDRGLERALRAVERGYGWLLDRALRLRFLVWIAFVASIGAAGWMAMCAEACLMEPGLAAISRSCPERPVHLTDEQDRQFSRSFI